MEWLANLNAGYIVAVSVVLLVIRLILGKNKSPMAKPAAEIVESALIAIVLVFLIIRPFVVQAFYIPSGSMIPTLEIHDRLLVNKFIYRFHEPRYGDIVVFKAPPVAEDDGVQRDFIKRLIGKAGDTIEVRDGAVYRNGERLKEPYIREPIDYEMSPVVVPKDRVFVMGDNRNDSNDSHAWGPLERRRILGKAMIIFSPLNRVRIIR